jgi:NAD(P)H-hydrate epimerase
VEPLPDWLMPLPDAETMRGVDRWAIEQQGVSGLELMERAGAAVAAAAERIAPDGAVTVLCGKGNNGGDGYVAARLLREAGHHVTVLSVAPLEELRGDAAASLAALPGEPPLVLEQGQPLPGEPLASAAVVIDALLGTGFQGEPHGTVATAIEAINALDDLDSARPALLSVDVPSGVDASTGEVAGVAVRAHTTVTFHAAKPGHWINPGKTLAGELQVAAIGIPRGAPMTAAVGLIEQRVLELVPRRAAASTKFISGHVLVAGGSTGLTGAPEMAGTAAMRAGAGYVTALVPACVEPVVATAATPELMTRPLPDADGAMAEQAVDQALEASARGGSLALGPGLGRTEGAFAFARRLAHESQLPLVLDADGLNAHATRLEELAARVPPTVLTPHAGELGRLLGVESAEIERRRLHHVRDAAARSRAIVLLKGDDTLIACPDGRVAVSPGGSAALATAGTGDVLTGVLAALLAQSLEPFAAAAAAVLIHARAGRLAARRIGSSEGVIATDVIAALPVARPGRKEDGDA